MGRERSGIAGLLAVGQQGLAGATVDARSAPMGDGLSSYHDGVISAVNELAGKPGAAFPRRAVALPVGREITSG
jgi:hypothetical protein